MCSMSSAHLAHHFDDLTQQREAQTLGMWIFLVTEIMFFGGAFAAYMVYRWHYPLAFAEASRHLDVVLGTVNTGVLLISSYTVALSIAALQAGRRRLVLVLLGLTIALGAVFIGIKAVEYSHKFHEHLVPGPGFMLLHPHYEGIDARRVEIFFALYFAMTGLHALHMVIGIGIFSVLGFFILRGHYGPGNNISLELAGLYWHFVDIVWVFLFPLLYLV